MRELMNAIFFVLGGRMLPGQFPPHQTACRWFTRFRDDGTWENLNHQLVMQDRERVGREAGPSAAAATPSPCCELSCPLIPFIDRVFAGNACAAERVANATRIIVEIVHKQPGQIGRAVQPSPAKDFEARVPSATAFLYAASVMLLARRLARSL
jgi:putative transposase